MASPSTSTQPKPNQPSTVRSCPPSRSTSPRRTAGPLSRAPSTSRSGMSIPIPTPIPPSLRASPLLHSPHSIFKRTTSFSQTPSDEDERWLQDTVPQSAETAENEKSAEHSSRGAPPRTPLRTPSQRSERRARTPAPNVPNVSDAPQPQAGYFDCSFSVAPPSRMMC
ncbi:hypothetical protein CYLTODRAFT_76539 [Cylindrobasidium torrendii FP15055 ss-10]|uniref:Uncharacterized protein n=1 Tax=Cylindrobasidium torrendii FP15055 ss-10 TaxID=1314674 RepID=A0A0D7B676_9AGAR|nr:hypothetical protein CYLTODRAFT_76539 [Cylindrobasidium torrendii FP15055 ss-10]